MHPFGDLSAYLDGALSPEAQASVQAHLDTCAPCRTRLAELRGTARLIAALPMPVPSRSLVPRISVPFWLAPLRTFSTFASGAAILLFLASAVLSTFPSAVGTSAGGAAAPAAAPNTLSAPQPGVALDASTGAPSEFKATTPSGTPAPNATAGTSAQRALQSPTPPDAPGQAGRQEAAGPSSDIATDTRLDYVADPFAVLRSPWLWLAVGMAFAALSFILGRRLRST